MKRKYQIKIMETVKKILYLLLSLQMSVVFAYSSDYKIDKNTSVKEIRTLLNQVLELKRTGVSVVKSGVQIVDVARRGNVEEVQKLLIEGDNPDKPNKFGYVALTGAAGKCTSNHLKILRMLVKHGADINRKATSDGTTAIGHASFMGCENNVKLLIELGANVNIVKKHNEYTPLIEAITAPLPSDRVKIVIVKMLLDAGADPNYGYVGKYSKKWTTILDVAKSYKNSDVVNLITKHLR
jgi:ankyrin repeat protein